MKQRILLCCGFLFFALCIFAQETITIKGTIRDDRKQPLPGATVLQKGTTNGTTTDDKGNFTLTVPKDAKLVVSYIGYADKEVNVDAKQPNVNVEMAVSDVSLNQ